MTQTVEKEKTGFNFPSNEPLLVVRPCLQTICLHIHPAANLLSVLLYHARGCSEQETTFTLYRTQEQLVRDMCNEVSEKTLHKVAVPLLQLIGVLEIEDNVKTNCYTVHLMSVRKALSLYLPNQVDQPQLEKFLIECIKPQLEKFLIECPVNWKNFLSNRKNLQLQLEKVLIANRKISYCPRGRKPRPQESSKGVFNPLEIIRDIKEILLERGEEITPAFAERNAPSPISQLDPSLEDFVMHASFEDWIKHHPSPSQAQTTVEHLQRAENAPQTAETSEYTTPTSLKPSASTPGARNTTVDDETSPVHQNGELTGVDKQASVLIAPVETTNNRARSSRKKVETPDLSPVLPPARPDPAMEWGVEKCIAWGDYVRRSSFPLSNHPQSKSFKSREAARHMVGREITENQFLLIYVNWMKGRDLDLQPLPEGALKSDTWPDYSADLWICDEHFEDEAAKYKKAKAKSAQDAFNSQRDKAQAIPGYPRLETINRRRKPMSMEEAAAELARIKEAM